MATPDEKTKEIMEVLRRQYDLTSTRRTTLTGQASNLTSFAAIINSILVAVLVGVATNADMRDVLATSVYYPIVFGLTVVGFVSYTLAVVLALFAYREGEWKPAPTIPRILGKSVEETIDFYITNPTLYDSKRAAFQLNNATEYNQIVNAYKYRLLTAGQALLVAGIVASALIGVAFLRIIAP